MAFSFLYCTAFKLYTVALHINCKTDVGEKRNIIILKSHLPTFLFVPGTFHAWCGGHEPVYSGTQLGQSFLCVSEAQKDKHKGSSYSNSEHWKHRLFTLVLFDHWCSNSSFLKAEGHKGPGDMDWKSLQGYPGLLVPIPFSTTISTSIISDSFSLEN